jgi:hypothetical protein
VENLGSMVPAWSRAAEVLEKHEVVPATRVLERRDMADVTPRGAGAKVERAGRRPDGATEAVGSAPGDGDPVRRVTVMHDKHDKHDAHEV